VKEGEGEQCLPNAFHPMLVIRRFVPGRECLLEIGVSRFAVEVVPGSDGCKRLGIWVSTLEWALGFLSHRGYDCLVALYLPGVIKCCSVFGLRGRLCIAQKLREAWQCVSVTEFCVRGILHNILGLPTYE
jgi:hypothetical protein